MAITDKLKAIADAIRSKTGKTEMLTLDNMPTEIEAIEVGGDGGLIDGIIDRSISGEYVNNNVKSVGTQVFRGCANLVSISFPNATSISSSAFYDCPSLVSIDIPKATSLSSRSFELCSSLKSAYLPNVASLSSYVFQDCPSLERVEFLKKLNNITTGTFNRCSKLDCLILRDSSRVCPLNNVNALAATPIESGNGYVYVPASLVDNYKSATNWAVYADQIRAIEDYPEICG